MWTLLTEPRERRRDLVLTTQYLDEADRLADRSLVLDHGRIVARGHPAELKARYGRERIVVTLTDEKQAAKRRRRRSEPFAATGRSARDMASCARRPGTRLIEVVRGLDAAGVEADDVHRRDQRSTTSNLQIVAAQRPTRTRTEGGAHDEHLRPQPQPAHHRRWQLQTASSSRGATSPTSARSPRSSST